MERTSPTVFIVDDDPSARIGLERLVKATGLDAVSYDQADDFLLEDLSDRHGCLVLDCKLPGMTGPELQQELLRRDCPIPIIFISAFGDVETTASTMKHGAVDFLTKPVDQTDLIAALESALEKDSERFKLKAELDEMKLLVDSLTKREYQVMTYVIIGLLNKQIAWELGITEDTVKIHRHRVMKKLQLVSVAELVRFCLKVGIQPVEIKDPQL